MISKMALKTATLFANKNSYRHDEIEVYKYGFELLISTAFNFASILIISLIMGTLLEAMLFFIAFIPLRVTAGGYHAKHHWSCFLIVNVTYLTLSIIQSSIDERFIFAYVLFITLFTSIIIWTMSPMEADNKPLSQKKKEKLRERSILIACFNMGLVCIFVFIPNLPITILASYLTGAFASAISLIAAYATKPKKLEGL